MVGDGKIEEEFVHQLLDFGDVPIGTSTSKTFQVKNMSSVNANVSISHQISGTVAMDKVFVCKKRQHLIKPYSSISVKVGIIFFSFSHRLSQGIPIRVCETWEDVRSGKFHVFSVTRGC